MDLSATTLGQLSRLGELFGPFFFAVLFVLVVTRSARNYYYAVCSRTNPRATAEEIKSYKLYFVVAVFFGIALVVLSLAWWVYYQTRGSYTYQVAITELDPTVRVEAPYFAKQTLRASNVIAQAMSDEFFLIVQDHPFKEGDKFTFTVYVVTPQPGAPANPGQCLGGAIQRHDIEVVYQGRTQDTYKLQLDPVKLVDAGSPNESRNSLVARDPPRLAAAMCARPSTTSKSVAELG